VLPHTATSPPPRLSCRRPCCRVGVSRPAVGELRGLLALLAAFVTMSTFKVLGLFAYRSKVYMTDEQLVDALWKQLVGSLPPVALRQPGETHLFNIGVDVGYASRGLTGHYGATFVCAVALALQSVLEAVQAKLGDGARIRVLWVVDGVRSQLETKHFGKDEGWLHARRMDMLHAAVAGLAVSGVAVTPGALVYNEVVVGAGEADPALAHLHNEGRLHATVGEDTDTLMHATGDLFMFGVSRHDEHRVVSAAAFFSAYALELDLPGDITAERRRDLQALAVFHAAIGGSDPLLCHLKGVGRGTSLAAICKMLGGDWNRLALLAADVRANVGLPERWVDAYLDALPQELQPSPAHRDAMKKIMAHAFHDLVTHAVTKFAAAADIGGGGGAGSVAALLGADPAHAALPVPAAPVMAAMPGRVSGGAAALPVAAPAAGMEEGDDAAAAAVAAAEISPRRLAAGARGGLDVPAPARAVTAITTAIDTASLARTGALGVAVVGVGSAGAEGGGGNGASRYSAVSLRAEVNAYAAKSNAAQEAEGGGLAAAASDEAAGGGGREAAAVVAAAAAIGAADPPGPATTAADALGVEGEDYDGDGDEEDEDGKEADIEPVTEVIKVDARADVAKGYAEEDVAMRDAADVAMRDAARPAVREGGGGADRRAWLAERVALIEGARTGVPPSPIMGIFSGAPWGMYHSQPRADAVAVCELAEQVRNMASEGEPADFVDTVAARNPDHVLTRALLAHLEVEHGKERLHESLQLPFLTTQAVVAVQQAVEAGGWAVHATRTAAAAYAVRLQLQRGLIACITLFCTTPEAAEVAASAFKSFLESTRDDAILRELAFTPMPDHRNFHHGDAVAAVNAIGRAVVCLLRQQLNMPRGGDGVYVSVQVPGGRASAKVPASLVAHERFVRDVMMEAAEACRDVCWRNDAALRATILANPNPCRFEHVCVAVHAAGEAAAASARITADVADTEFDWLRFQGCWFGCHFSISLHIKRGATVGQRDAVLQAMAAKLRDLRAQRAMSLDPAGVAVREAMRRAMREAAGVQLASSRVNAESVSVSRHDGTRVRIWVQPDTPQAVRNSVLAAGHAAWWAARAAASDALDRNHVGDAVQAAVTRAAAAARAAADGALAAIFPTQHVSLTELTTAVHARTADVDVDAVERVVWWVMPGGEPISFRCPASHEPAVVAAAAAALLLLIDQVGAALLEASPSSVRLINWCRPGTRADAISRALAAARDATVAPSPFHRIDAFLRALRVVPYFPDSPYAFGAPVGIANIAKLKDELRGKRWLHADVQAALRRLVVLHWGVLHARLSGLLGCPMPSWGEEKLQVKFTPDGGGIIQFLIPAGGGAHGEAVRWTLQLAAYRIKALVRACLLAKNADDPEAMAGDRDGQVLLVAAQAVQRVTDRPLTDVLLESFHVWHALRLDVWKISGKGQLAADGVLPAKIAGRARPPAGWTSDPAHLPAAAAERPVVMMLRPIPVADKKESTIMAPIAPSPDAAAAIREALRDTFSEDMEPMHVRTSLPELVAGRRLDILCPLAIALRGRPTGDVAAAAADADAGGGGGGGDAASAAGGAGAVADRPEPRWEGPWPEFEDDALSPDDAALLERLFPPPPVAAPAPEPDAAPAAKRPRLDDAADAGGGGGAAVPQLKEHTGTVADLKWLAPLITKAAPPEGGAGGGGVAAGAGARGKKRAGRRGGASGR
jgi:hypothetical protein